MGCLLFLFLLSLKGTDENQDQSKNLPIPTAWFFQAARKRLVANSAPISALAPLASPTIKSAVRGSLA